MALAPGTGGTSGRYYNPYVIPTGTGAPGRQIAGPSYGALPYSGYGGQTTGQVVQAATPTAAGTAPSGGGGGSLPAWNPSSDPIVQAITGQSNLSIAQAKARLLRLQKQTLIGYGSSSLAQQVLGKKDPILNSISGNPDKSFSFLANLKRSYGTPVGQKSNWYGSGRMGLIPQAEEQLNQDNLWFSSYHGNVLQSLAQQKLQQQDVEQQRVQGALGQYQDEYLGSVTAAKNAIQNAILQRQATLAMAGLGGTSY